MLPWPHLFIILFYNEFCARRHCNFCQGTFLCDSHLDIELIINNVVVLRMCIRFERNVYRLFNLHIQRSIYTLISFLTDEIMFLNFLPIKFLTHSISLGISKLSLFHKNILVKLHIECRNLVLHYPFIGIYYTLFILCRNLSL